MNLLTDAPPNEVEIDGRQYAVNSDFRSCLRIILAFEDNDLTNAEKQMIMMSNLYPVIPNNMQAAFTKGGWFLNGGKPSHDEDESAPRLYSFSRDADLIFAAFRQTHGIDIKTVDLHWWEFLALFLDLGADTTFCNLINLRKRVKTGKASKEEKAAARAMGEAFEVPEIETMTLEEREAEAEFMRLIGANK